jgi:hypothetical protein
VLTSSTDISLPIFSPCPSLSITKPRLVDSGFGQNLVSTQANEIKELNSLNDLSATLATNYEHLLCKFKLLSKVCDELKSKLESNETKTSNSFEIYESSIPCASPISKVDASTSCNDFIDEFCSLSCNKNVVVETCDSLIGKKNDDL